MEPSEYKQSVYKRFLAMPIIDIGCGFNKAFDCDYVAFDKANVIVNLPSVATHFGDFNDMHQFSDNTFGFINATHVIEHSKTPEVAIKEWTRILKPGCYMLIEWPSWCPKHTTTEQKQFREWDAMLSYGKTSEYLSDGGNMAWVSRKPDGTMFLDVHYSNMTFDEFCTIVPDNLKIVEHVKINHSFVVLKKDDENNVA